jgi:hypothetical protein
MAGGLVSKNDSKKLHIKNNFSNEALTDSQPDQTPPPIKLNLRGILGIGQTIEFSKPVSLSKELFSGINHLAHEQSILFDQRHREWEKAIKDLRREITKLGNTNNELEKVVASVEINEINEISEYQVNFFIRIRNLIADFTKSISETSLWVQTFAAKKKKQNYFWTKANDKKKGGTQFMYNDESSVARNVG